MSRNVKNANSPEKPASTVEDIDAVFGDLGRDIDVFAEAARLGLDLGDLSDFTPLMLRIIQIGEALHRKGERFVLSQGGEDYRYTTLQEQADEEDMLKMSLFGNYETDSELN